MPFAGEGRTNTQLLIQVAPSAQDTQVKCTWPQALPATHGVLTSDSQGNMSWTPQLLSGLLGNMDNAYYATGLIDSSGSVTITPSPVMQYKSYTSAVVVGLLIRAYAYLGDASQGSTAVQVAEIKTGLLFQPNASSLAQLWTALPASFFGETTPFITGLQVNAVRVRGQGCAPTITVTGQAGAAVNLEIRAFTPYNVPLAVQPSAL